MYISKTTFEDRMLSFHVVIHVRVHTRAFEIKHLMNGGSHKEKWTCSKMEEWNGRQNGTEAVNRMAKR